MPATCLISGTRQLVVLVWAVLNNLEIFAKYFNKFMPSLLREYARGSQRPGIYGVTHGS